MSGDPSFKYRVVLMVGGVRVEGPWERDESVAVETLALIERAQMSNAPVRLPWLLVVTPNEISVAFVERRRSAMPRAGGRTITGDLPEREF